MNKYIIWGCGVRGKIAENMLEKGEVVAFVDEKLSKEQLDYNGYAIWNKKQLLEQYNGEVVIVTPRGYEDGIVQWLQDNDINRITLWGQEQWQVIAFLKQVNRDKLIKKFHTDTIYKVYGYEILSDKVINWLKVNGIEAYRTTQLEDVNTGDNVIVTKKIDDKEEQQHISQCELIDVYMLNEDIANIDISDLSQFYNKHKGEKCFIVATGPSLRIEDLDVLSENHICCISVNSIYNVFGKTSWRPRYYGISDFVGYMEMENNILNMDVENKFIMDAMWDDEKHSVEKGFYRWHLNIEDKPIFEPSFSEDINQGFFGGKTVTYDFALQFAVYLGFKEIYLLGVDCNYIKGSKHNHFSESNKLDEFNHEEDKMIEAYKSAKRYADANGIKIYNATRGGMLEVFERVDFDSLFQGKG